MRKWSLLSGAGPRDAGQRSALLISLTQCMTALSLNFVDITLPFYVAKISPYSQQVTLRWVGLIMGINFFCLMFAAPVWGALTHRFSPKKLYQRGQVVDGILFILMAFTVNLQALFLLRLLQGVFGGVSTVGLILVSSSSSKAQTVANIGLYQSFLTLGQLVGPPLGSLAAATLGFKGAFLCGSALLFCAALVCQFQVADVAKLPREAKAETGGGFDKRILIAWAVCMIAQVQLMFLPSILPKVLETFHIYGAQGLKVAGIVVMCYTAATAAGTFNWTRFATRIGLFRLIVFLLIMGTLFQTLLAFTGSVFDFTLVRMLQTGCVAAVIPLAISLFAGEAKGSVIGFLNTARFAGGAAGPILATSMLAASSLKGLYFLISGLTVLPLIGFLLAFRSGGRANPLGLGEARKT